ncbi:hypothetical protein GTA07_29165 [Rhodococcus hoagii]|nr:hypothetical protein [Prescottella equi]
MPELGVAGLRAKIDTGASTSSLHATEIEPFERNGQPWVDSLRTWVRSCNCVTAAAKRRCEHENHPKLQWPRPNRYVIRTTLALGDRVWAVEFTLACRKSMRTACCWVPRP